MKKIFTLLMSILMCLAIATPVFAENETVPNTDFATTVTNVNLDGAVSPMADTDRYYVVKNKSYLYNNKYLHSYLTNVWAKASSYTLTESWTKQSSLSVSPTSGTFPLSAVLSSGSFTKSISRTFSVSTTIPADSSKYSKLTVQESKRVHTGDLYYVTSYGWSYTEDYKGSGYVYEPQDLYIEVIYQ